MLKPSGEYAEINIAVPWGHIAGRWYGDQLQQPLLALHGWLDNCGTFARLAPLLSSHTSILCIDFPGHGLSSHLPAGVLYNILEYVRVLIRLMQSYKWEKISILGHSMGGKIGFIFASLYPERVDLLVSLDVLVFSNKELDKFMVEQHYITERALIDNERLQMNSPMIEPPSYTYQECESLLYEGSMRSVELRNCKYLLERNITKSVIYPDKYYFSRDGRVKTISVLSGSNELVAQMGMRICKRQMPYLVIRGGTSQNMSETTLKTFVPIFEKYNNNFEIHTLENGTHHLHLNNPKEVAAIIMDFLKRKNWINPQTGLRTENVGKGHGEKSKL